MSSPGQKAEADQIRAAISEAMLSPCTCGECATDEELLIMLAMPDEKLLDLVNGAEG